MKIVFSRHARRRLKLYRIEQQDIVNTIESSSKEQRSSVEQGFWIIDKSLTVKYAYPVKVVFVQEEERIVVVTAYPLKKGKKT